MNSMVYWETLMHALDLEQWTINGAMRPFGYSELNKAGEELLSFLVINGAIICNT